MAEWLNYLQQTKLTTTYEVVGSAQLQSCAQQLLMLTNAAKPQMWLHLLCQDLTHHPLRCVMVNLALQHLANLARQGSQS